MKNIIKFFNMNKNIILINAIYMFAIFNIVTIINPILIKDYGFNQTVLSYSFILFSIGAVSGTFFFRYILSFRFNYLKILSNLFLTTSIIYIIYILLIMKYKYYNMPIFEYLYIILKLIEGFIFSGLTSIIGYYIGYKLVNNKLKGTINSINGTIFYSIKMITPLIASAIVVYTQNIIYIFILSIILFFSLYYYTIKNYQRINKDYYRYNYKKHNVKKKAHKGKFKFSNIFSFKFIGNIYSKKKKEKINVFFEIILQNLLRTFYDFYLIIILMYVYKLSLIQSTSLISFYLLGQTFNVKIGIFFDYIENKYKNIKLLDFIQTLSAAIFNTISFLIFIYLYDNIEKYQDNIYSILLVLLMFFGIIKNIYNDRMGRKILHYSKEENNLENYKATLLLTSEIFNGVGYILASIVYYFYGYIGIIYYCLIISIILLIKSFYFFKRYISNKE